MRFDLPMALCALVLFGCGAGREDMAASSTGAEDVAREPESNPQRDEASDSGEKIREVEMLSQQLQVLWSSPADTETEFQALQDMHLGFESVRDIRDRCVRAWDAVRDLNEAARLLDENGVGSPEAVERHQVEARQLFQDCQRRLQQLRFEVAADQARRSGEDDTNGD
ncbi:MAG: hypothetical protein AAGE52_10605 [Myxococcota bacterium]